MIVRLNSTLRGQSGMRELAVDLPAGATVRAVLTQALADHPALHPALTNAPGDLRSDLVIFRDGRNLLFEQGMETALAAGDKLDLFPPTGAQRAFAVESYP
jgi:molybdopterin converting factor small subunit